MDTKLVGGRQVDVRMVPDGLLDMEEVFEFRMIPEFTDEDFVRQV
jgi:hypothetical protein